IFVEDTLKNAGFQILDVTKISIVKLPVEIVIATMGNKSFRSCFIESFSTRKQKTAIKFLRNGEDETVISYPELDRDSNQMARTFVNLGVQKGDRVILFLEKSLIFVSAHIALQKIGAIAVPLNPGFKKTEMAYLVQDADAKLILLEPEKEKLIKEIDPTITSLVIDTKRRYQDLDFFRSASGECPDIEIREDDPALIIYTSGTTGNPKGAVLTQKNLIHDARNIISIWKINKNDVLCHSLPLFHVHGMCFALHTALISGSTILMLDKFSPEHVTSLLSSRDKKQICTLFMAVPTIYNKLMEYLGEKRPDFKHIRLWTSGSAPLLAKDFEKIHEIFGKEPVEREGMSETGMNFSNPLKGRRKPGSIGLPLPDLGVRIVNPRTGTDVQPGQTGEIWLKGPSITPGYWKKPEETARSFENGWFRTSDLGKVDEDGYYYLTDRINHIIISGGENISPKEIEVVINKLDGVEESSVVGVPDEEWGEKLVAAVVTKASAPLKFEDIRAHCRKHLHDWKCPKEIVFVEELPRNTMGKVLKKEVKKFF
ncbi:MAG: acyl--CoA ligase, partial [Spirochaetota bacterium]